MWACHSGSILSPPSSPVRTYVTRAPSGTQAPSGTPIRPNPMTTRRTPAADATRRTGQNPPESARQICSAGLAADPGVEVEHAEGQRNQAHHDEDIEDVAGPPPERGRPVAGQPHAERDGQHGGAHARPLHVRKCRERLP